MDVILGEEYLKRLNVLLKALRIAGARNRNHVFSLCEYPGEGELGRCDPFLLRDLPHCVCDCKVVLELLALKTGIASAPIIWSELINTSETRTEKSSPQRTIGDK